MARPAASELPVTPGGIAALWMVTQCPLRAPHPMTKREIGQRRVRRYVKRQRRHITV